MNKLLWMLAVVLVLAACGSETKEKSYSTVDLEDIETLQKDGAITVDVRESDEYAQGHIPGAVNLPLSDIQEGSRNGLNEGQKYVIICRSGNRSQTASELLFEDGYDVVNVSEGMSTWQGQVEK
ncbi:rhodanese-like domain-containing protein [Sporosarcina sp.]|uniref:rhodanese-like domain-containing protein n=1 Tax=Sporosarcina sp. TaxID=49982 RepID=UPI002629222F|nr:rhodanese-like domain-containing protein [Sporosarcina sp.]